MNILYVTANVLGSSGANASEIIPRCCSVHDEIDHYIIADFKRNKKLIQDKLFGEFLKLKYPKRSFFNILKNAGRIAKKAKRSDVDLIHIFYRQENALLCIFIRFFLLIMRSKSKILMDHRSVNLAKKNRKKLLLNQIMQLFVHALGGNPYAVETNHKLIFKKKYTLDLGYDIHQNHPIEWSDNINAIWYIGSLKPKNRQSEFIINLSNFLLYRYRGSAPFKIHIAGPASREQIIALKKNPLVIYHGKLPRHKLHNLMCKHPGIGLAINLHQH